MDEQQIIRQFFNDETDAKSYIESRLLGNFEEAPPPTSDRFIEEFPTDFLRQIVNNLEDKTIFWNACFHLFKAWRDPERADKNRATGLRELIYMIRQFDSYQKEIFRAEKDRWLEELDADNLRESPYREQEKNLVYVQNVSLVHIWDLWPNERWVKLYENIVRKSGENNDAQFELLLILTQHLKWDAAKTRQLFKWTVDRRTLPENFYNQYFFHRLCLCGNGLTKTAIVEQKSCQTTFLDDILKTHGTLFYHNVTTDKKMALGKALLEASELFDLKSFKCLDAGKRWLLNRELAKLTEPPAAHETNMLKPNDTASSGSRYMNSQYARDLLLSA